MQHATITPRPLTIPIAAGYDVRVAPPPAPPRYLADLVAARLAELGYPGSVAIHPRVPLAARLESGERARFVVAYRGAGTAHLVLEDWDLIKGSTGASIAHAVADLIAARLHDARAA